MNYPDYNHRVSVRIGALAEAYGVTPKDAGIEDPEEKVALWRGQDGWHIAEDYDDESWAPKDDAQAEEVFRVLGIS